MKYPSTSDWVIKIGIHLAVGNLLYALQSYRFGQHAIVGVVFFIVLLLLILNDVFKLISCQIEITGDYICLRGKKMGKMGSQKTFEGSIQDIKVATVFSTGFFTYPGITFLLNDDETVFVPMVQIYPAPLLTRVSMGTQSNIRRVALQLRDAGINVAAG